MQKPNITELIHSCRVYFDGALGTELQRVGLPNGTSPESWNLENPEAVKAVHLSYLEAGCDIITANTFGINRLKYENYPELIRAAMSCVKEALEAFPQAYAAFDVGPTGRLLEPYGDLSFDDAVSVFRDNIELAAECGAELVIIETMNDCHETKASVLAAKEGSCLPVFVSNVYGASSKLMTGGDPAAMTAMLEGLGVDAIGMNCSLGPDKMLSVMEAMDRRASVPVIAMPNAGLPEMKDGRTSYSMKAAEFSDCMVKLALGGASILGGCCGAGPEYIKMTIEKTKSLPFSDRKKKNLTTFSSYTHAVTLGGSAVLIGERINPTGKKRFKEALRKGDMDYIVSEGVKQAEAGAHALDVNAGLPEIDEPAVLRRCVMSLQAVTDLPLQLDSSDPEALEASMRIYNGKPLINSVNGKDESMKAVFPLIKKYGGAVIALTLDESGIPETAAGRVEIAEKIIRRAAECGIDKKEIIVDPLTLTVSSDPKSAEVTLKALELLREKGIMTSLGVSNISFGLPRRDLLNSIFFANAMDRGLGCAIMNPFSEAMMSTYYSFCALHGLDSACAAYISYSADTQGDSSSSAVAPASLGEYIFHGMCAKAAESAAGLLENSDPLDVINREIIPALNRIGADFESGKAFLPQLLMSADAATAAFSQVKKKLPASEGSGETVILATVRGDIHDIGKNIVRVMLESYGFKVLDLGRDTPPEKVLEAVKQSGCRLVGLSALMTTTVPAMEETIALLHGYDKSVKTVVGGAVLTSEYAKSIGSDYYANDAMDTVRLAEEFYHRKERQTC